MTIGETVTRALDAARAEYESVRSEISKHVGETPFEILRDAARLEGARDKIRALQATRRITAARIMVEGPAEYARELAEIFASEGGLPIKQGRVLCLADGQARDYWSSALHVDSTNGGLAEPSNAAQIIADHKGTMPEWFKLHRDARGVAFDRDWRAWLFIRKDGRWLGGDELTAHLEAKRAEEQAASDARWQRLNEETEARAAEEERLREECAARFAEDSARIDAELEAEAAKATAEAEMAEQQRLESLGDVAADPATVVAIAQCLGLVRDNGTMRPLLSEQDLQPFSGGVVISKAAAARIVDALGERYIPPADRIARILDAIERAAVRSHGRTSVSADIGHPYNGAIEVAFVAYCDKPQSTEAFDGASGSLVDRTIQSFGRRSSVGRGRVVLTTADEVVPLAWRGL